MKKETLEKIKPHLAYLVVLLILILIFHHHWLNLYGLTISDKVTSYHPELDFLKKSVLEHGDSWPLWTPYWMGGIPFLQNPAPLGIDYFPGMLAILLPVVVAMKISYLLNYLLAGLFMYLLVIYLGNKPLAAFVSAIVYVFNGFMVKVFAFGWLTTLDAYALLPLVVLLTIKTFKSRKWVQYSLMLGILLAIQLRAGPDLKVLAWTIIVLGIYFLFSLIGKNFSSRFVKGVLISLIVALVLFGLSAQRVIPNKESLYTSNRADLSYDQSASRRVHVGDLFERLVEPFKGPSKDIRTEKIGIIAFLLVCFGIIEKRNKKHTWFFITIAILSILLATGSVFYYVLWKYIPPFASMRYVDRALVLWVFAGSVLTGIGVSSLMDRLKKWKMGKNVRTFVYILIPILVFGNLYFFNYDLYEGREIVNVKQALDQNYIMQNLSKMPGIFRIHTYETHGIDWGTEFYTVPLGLENIYGYVAIWLPEYMNVYLSVANQQPARFWGILNVKYLTSTEEINISGFKFLKKYKDCEVCFPEAPEWEKAWGPYLYENELFLPRVYFVNNSILVVGNKNDVVQTTYALMLNQNFNPSNTVIIMGEDKKINDYEQEFLNRFSAIFLTQGSVDENSMFKLKNYVESNGILIPNIVKGETLVPAPFIENVLKSFTGKLKAVDDSDIITNSFERKTIALKNWKKGFLVLSEQYAIHPGWIARGDNNKMEILKADGVITSVYVNSEKEISFEYQPKSYRTGYLISLFSFVAVCLIFMYLFVKRKK